MRLFTHLDAEKMIHDRMKVTGWARSQFKKTYVSHKPCKYGETTI